MSRSGAAVATDLREWGSAAPPGFSWLERLWLALVLGVPGGALALAASLFGGAPAALVIALAYCGLVWWWLARQGRAALAALGGAQMLADGDAPRLHNLAEGIGGDLGLESPRLFVGGDDDPNAFACWAGGPVILVSRAMLEGYTRSELEAVVAHSLIRLSRGERRRAVVAAALGSLAGPAGVVRHGEADLRTVALTRYPPALAAAIDKASPVGGGRASFWFVPAAAGSASQAERVRRLRDL